MMCDIFAFMITFQAFLVSQLKELVDILLL